MSETISIPVNIEGRVQGVWFRSWSLKEATFLGLSGWVRNKPDGSFKAVFQALKMSCVRCWKGAGMAQFKHKLDRLLTSFVLRPIQVSINYRRTDFGSSTSIHLRRTYDEPSG
jgi:acylphosphatase